MGNSVLILFIQYVLMHGWMIVILLGVMLFFGCSAQEYIEQPTDVSMEAENQYLFPEISAPGSEEATAAPASLGSGEERCEDTDGGFDIHTKGTTRIIVNGVEDWSKEDFCMDSETLYEYYCEGDALTHDTIKCPCSLGKCEPVLDYIECVDSDGGNEKYVQGEIKLIKHYTDGTTVEEYPVEDHCISEVSLIEYFCGEGGDFRKYTYTCLYCVDGVCTN